MSQLAASGPGEQTLAGKVTALFSTLKIRPGYYAGCLAVISLGGWLALRLVDGSLSYYLHPRFNILVVITALVIVFNGGWLLLNRPTGDNARAYNRPDFITGLALIVLIALLGLLVTPQPLDSNRLIASTSNRSGVQVNEGGNRALAEALLKQDWKNAASLDTVRWSLLDWTAALNDPQRAEQLAGRPVDVTGFFIRSKSDGSQYFLIGRYVVICCTADSSALRMPVIGEAAADLEEGQWIRVKGVLGQAANGTSLFMAGSVEAVPRPAQPYIFP